MKKILTLFIYISLFFTVSSVSAVGPQEQVKKEINNEVTNTVQENINESVRGVDERKQERIEVREKVREQKQSLLDTIKDKLKKTFRWAAHINGTITLIGENTLTVTGNDNKIYTVNISDQTQLRRRFWGKSTLAEFSEGNKVLVIGRWTDENQNTIDARLIRNLSIERRWGVFFGTVTEKLEDYFTIDAVKRGAQKVYFDSGTKFINRNQETIGYEDVAEGHRIRVKGVWDKTLNEIIQVDEVKDFSLPLQPKTTPTTSPVI